MSRDLVTIAAEPLFGAPGIERDRVDAAIIDAANSIGVLLIHGPSPHVATARAERAAVLAPFGLSEAQQRVLWRNAYDPEHPNIYRGWNPRTTESTAEIYDMGRDLFGPIGDTTDDPLLGATPFPDAALLPGWREAAARWYLSMELLGAALMRSIARGLGLREDHFAEAFEHGISTLRLLRYEQPGRPARDTDDAADAVADAAGMPRRGEHVDSGFVTLLCQHDVGGLEVKLRDGSWLPVEPDDGRVVVNFGGVLERWTGGRIRATPHRVISHAPIRHSIPFFYEPRADAVIEPIPGISEFEPFSYGDHLWAAMSKFPNFTSVAALRRPRGPFPVGS